MGLLLLHVITIEQKADSEDVLFNASHTSSFVAAAVSADLD